MIELIKEVGTILKDIPELAIWILLGLLAYKIFIVGGVISIIKMLINKIHNILELSSNNKIKPKEVIVKYEIDKLFITACKPLFDDLLSEMRGARCSIGSQYIHKQDVEFLLDAIKEKKDRDRIEEQK